ncbi:MAG: sugar phosphate nucleotidyltransferase [Patescibacteria group bacterium]|nr:sugar phosphate nucleotidyltransferase [Patescibacteria group bacterium]
MINKLDNIIILAGGENKRFWPLTDKNLFSFLGQPLIEKQIINFSSFAKKIIIITNSKNYLKIKKIILKIKPKTLIEVYRQNNKLKGQAGAILTLKNKLKGEVLFVNANDVFDYQILTKIISQIKKNKSKILLVGKKISQYQPLGYFVFKNKQIIGIVEKPAKNNLPSNVAKMFIDYFFEATILFKKISAIKTVDDDWYERSLTDLINEYQKIDFFLYDNFWFTLKYPWHILPMMSFFLKNLKINEGIFLGKNVKISKTARIVPPCFIDDGTIIGDFCLIRESHIGKNCLIGSFSEVARSYLGKNVSLHRNYIGDSILDDKVHFGAGAITANFRFDAQNVKSVVKEKKIDSQMLKLGTIVGQSSKIGVNATLLPGVKIGRNSFIGPRELVDQDIKDNKFLFKGKVVNNKIR